MTIRTPAIKPATLFRRIYTACDGYADISRSDEREINRSRSSSVYGEIMPGATEKLLNYLKVGKKDVVYDLGSGVGKFVIQTALTRPVGKVVGIELSRERHRVAQYALRETKKLAQMKATNVTFRNADILKARMNDATIVYTCSTAFPPVFLNRVVQKLSSLKPGTVFVSLQEIEENDWFDHTRTLRLDMSWERRVPVYIYERNSF